jgi:uncharacterized BrkB/YihY/UPF0761 family membrane protein
VDPNAAPPEAEPPDTAVNAALEKHGRIARLKAERARLTARVIDTRDQLNDRRGDSFVINTAFSLFERDSAAGGPVLAGAVAFRVFLFQVPYVFVLVAGLGLASSADHKDPAELARDAGIGGLTAQAIGDFGNISVWGRITALVVGGFALFLAARSAVKVLRIIHSLVWAVPVVRAKHLSRQAGVFIVLVTIALALATFVGWLRDRSFVGGLVGTILYIVVPTATWLIVSWFLPRAEGCSWVDMLPGAIVFGVGVEALHVFTVYWIAREVSSKSDTYGALGTSLALLFWAYLLGRLIVASANLNATRWHLLRARDAAAAADATPTAEPEAE